MAPSRENSLSEPHASMLHAFCACNYIHLPLARQPKTSVSVSRFAPLRHFQYKLDYNAEALERLSALTFVKFFTIFQIVKVADQTYCPSLLNQLPFALCTVFTTSLLKLAVGLRRSRVLISLKKEDFYDRIYFPPKAS